MQFLKKHYEKIILCVVLLGLAAAAIWMGAEIAEVQREVNEPVGGSRPNNKELASVDLTADMLALSEITNPPPLVLSGEHNLFNPVTWKRRSDGELLKILTNGPDALSVTNLTPLYTEITYERPTGTDGAYVFSIQTNALLNQPGKRKPDYSKKDEKSKTGLYTITAIKGSPDDPTAIQLLISETQENVWISKDKPYKQVDGYAVDLKYDPDPEARDLHNKRVNGIISLDNEKYKIVEITTNFVRVQATNNGKVTTIKVNGNP